MALKDFSKVEHLTRQMDLIPMEVLGEEITIIGAGAVGSFCCLSLAKMGFQNITVYDFDNVDTVNLNSQFYPRSAVGEQKVQALFELVADFTGIEITAKDEAYEGQAHTGIVISALDSMAGRRLILDSHRSSLGTKAIIDPRMGGEYAHMYTVRPWNKGDLTMYEHTLYSDEDAVQEKCTAKATMYTVNLITGLVCKAVKDVLTDYPRWTKSVQWDIKQNAIMMNLRKVD